MPVFRCDRLPENQRTLDAWVKQEIFSGQKNLAEYSRFAD